MEYERFNLAGTYSCKVINVYDGDTITVVFNPFPDSSLSKDYKFSIRLAGIDTPELRDKNKVIKEYAKKIKSILENLILNKTCKLEVLEKFDKYGRILGIIYYNDLNINNYLVEKGYAKLYNGGTKIQWEPKDITFEK